MRNLFWLALLLLPRVGVAQSDSLLCTETFKPGKGSAGGVLIEENAGGIWFYERSSDREPSLMVARLDAGLSTLWRKTIPIPQSQDPGPQDPDQAVAIGGRLIIFSVGQTEREARWNAFATIADSTGRVITGPVLVHSVEDIWKSVRPTLLVRLSPDRSRMLVLFDPPHERRSQEPVSLSMLDSSLTLLWSRELELPYDTDIIQVHHFEPDNSGGVYLVSGESAPKSGTGWQKPQGNRYVVFHYDHGTNTLREFDVTLKDKQIGTFRMQVNAQDELVMAGFYSNDFQISAAGTFLFVLSARADAVRTASYAPFGEELLGQYLTERQVNRKAGLPDFYLDHLFIAADGTYWLVGEQFAISENLIMDPMTGRQLIERRFTFDDILIVQLGSTARIQGTWRVPKRQFDLTRNPLLSYVCLWDTEEQTLRVVFNDHPENERRMGTEGLDAVPLAWNGSRNAAVTQVKLVVASPETRPARQVIHRSRSSNFQLRPVMTSGSDAVRLIGLEGPRAFRFCAVP